MDDRTGRIYSAEQVSMMGPNDQAHMRPMQVAPTRGQVAKRRVGRNDPCPCGSDKKFKRCCQLVAKRDGVELL